MYVNEILTVLMREYGKFVDSIETYGIHHGVSINVKFNAYKETQYDLPKVIASAKEEEEIISFLCEADDENVEFWMKDEDGNTLNIIVPLP